jgi:hypothetical protein
LEYIFGEKPLSNDSTSGKENKEEHVIVPSEQEKNLKPGKPIDYILYIAIGTITSLVNMFVTAESKRVIPGDNWEDFLWGYLLVVVLVLVGGIVFGVAKRSRGFGYMMGYILGGTIELLRPGGDQIIAIYTIFASSMLFLSIVLCFRYWRKFTAFKYT